MSYLDTQYYERCIATLKEAFARYAKEEDGSIPKELYRSACVKEFELLVEQTVVLLRKALGPYFSHGAMASKLNYKDVLRHSSKFGLLGIEEAERWMNYRDLRNLAAHNYGSDFADETMVVLSEFIADTLHMAGVLKQQKL
jgi:hypothetical protein